MDIFTLLVPSFCLYTMVFEKFGLSASTDSSQSVFCAVLVFCDYDDFSFSDHTFGDFGSDVYSDCERTLREA